MKTLKLLIVTLALLGIELAGPLYAQDISGDWQGTLKSPTLAIYATPREFDTVDAAALEREGCARAFEKAVASSRVVRLPGAAHQVFLSNEADVLREIRDFVATLNK